MKLIKMNNLVILKWCYCALHLQGEGGGYLVFNVSFFSLKNKVQKHALLLLIKKRGKENTQLLATTLAMCLYQMLAKN